MTREGAGIKICEWNIHHQGGRDQEGKMLEEEAPGWVVDELKDQDIVVLTEFPTKTGSASKDSRSSIIGRLHARGFACFLSDNRRGNDVLIAVKVSLIAESKLEFSFSNPYCNEDKLIPENAFVKLKIGDRYLVVVGVRIRTLKDFKERKEQFDWLMDELKRLNEGPVLLVGDWNHGRVCSPNENWSIGAMTNCLEKMNYSVCPMEGSSIYQENGPCDFPDDHFIVSQAMLCLKEVKYDRDFTERDSSVYKFGRRGRDFCKWSSDENESVPPPFPDHAMLKATLSFTD